MPLVKITISVPGVLGGELGGANVPTVVEPVPSGLCSSLSTSGLASQPARQLCVLVKVSLTTM